MEEIIKSCNYARVMDIKCENCDNNKCKQEMKKLGTNEDRLFQERMRAENEYYADNNCFPRPRGYCGTETDAFLMEK